MRRIDAGLTFPEILVIAVIMAVVAALVVFLALALRVQRHEEIKVDCIDNVRKIVGLIEVNSVTKYPPYGGADLILYLVRKGEIVGERNLRILFCPGDNQESFRAVGGMNAYRGLDLGKKGAYGRYTSYAGRDQLHAQCVAKKGSMVPVILVCDDSEDHHDNKGFVVGYTGGATEWRDKVDTWVIDQDTPVEVGDNSSIDELKCLLAE